VREPSPFRILALLFIASRLALLGVGCFSTGVMGSGLAVQKGNLVHHDPAPLPLEIWSRWDAEWYLLIADRGYDAEDVFADLAVPYETSATAGFLPLYPFLIRALSPVFGGIGSGILISNLCLAGALALLFRLTERLAPGAAGQRAGLAACAALLLHPMSLFLSAVYAESLFLLLTLAAFDRSQAGRIGQASVCAALAAVTRPFGVLLALPILITWWNQWRATCRPHPLSLTWILLVPATLGGFMLYTGRLFGDPMVFISRQERWRGAMAGPWRAFTRWWEKGPAWHGAHDSTLEIGMAILFVLSLAPIARRLSAGYLVWSAAGVLLPLCSTAWSFGRFSLTVFPAFMMLGLSWSEGRRAPLVAWGFFGAVLSGLLMALYANWWWAG